MRSEFLNQNTTHTPDMLSIAQGIDPAAVIAGVTFAALFVATMVSALAIPRGMKRYTDGYPDQRKDKAPGRKG